MDLRVLQSTPGLANSADTTFVLLESAFLQDTSSNPFEGQGIGFRASVLVPDTQPPELQAFTLDVNASLLILSFNEPVNSSSLDITGFTLVAQRGLQDPAKTISFTSGNVTSAVVSDVVVVKFASADSLRIKSTSGLGENENNTYLTVDPNSITDTFDNALAEIDLANAHRATTVIPDDVPPEFVDFTLDLGTGMLELTFNEPLSIDNFMPSQFALQENNSDTVLAFSTSTSATNDLNTLTVTLIANDLNTVKTFIPLDPIFLVISSGAIADTAGNTFAGPVAARASNVSCETVNPQLSMFHINMSSGILTLFTTEPLDLTTVDVTDLTLQNTNINSTINFTLTGGDVSRHTTQPTGLLVQLSDEDLNELKRLGLCTVMSQCFAVYTTNLGSDVCGNSISDPVNGTAVAAAMVTPDQLRPTLVAFTELDLDSGRLTLSFSEPMVHSSVTPSSIILQDFSGTPSVDQPLIAGRICVRRTNRQPDGTETITEVYYESSNSVLQTVAPSEEIILLVDGSILDIIKADDRFCTSFTNCYVRVTVDALRDVAGNPVDHNILMLNTFIGDTTGPGLMEFSLDLNLGQFMLTFDEIVNPSTLDATALTLQNALEANVSYTLVGGTRTSSTAATDVTFSILEDDLNAIKALEGLATNRNNSFITFTSALVDDLSDNDARYLIDGVNATQAVTYMMDITQVSLSSFTQFDLAAETFTLTFNEPINIDSLDFTSITILAAQSVNSSSVTLSNGSAVYVDGTNKQTIIISLSEEDAISIKLNSQLATQQLDTFVSLEESAVQDVTGNMLEAITADSAVRVSTYVGDLAETALTSFSLDMDVGSMSLTFDDVVRLESLQSNLLVLQSSADGTSGVSQALSSIMLSSVQSGFVIDFRFGPNLLEAIQLNAALAVSLETSYLSVQFNAAQDYKNTAVRSIVPESALPASSYTPDTTPPTVTVYTLDLDGGLLLLTFSEVVNLTAFDATQITIQNSANSSVVTERVELTGGEISPPGPASTVNITLLTRDLNDIRIMMQLATNETTTFLAATNTTVSDMAGNGLLEIPPYNAKPAAQHVPDSTRPTLMDFFLDLNNGLLTLNFSELVLVGSLNETSLVFQNSQTPPIAITVPVTGGVVVTTEEYSDAIQLYLAQDVVDTLNDDPRIALTAANTFLTVSTGAVVDTRGLGNLPISSSFALSGGFSFDSRPPLLEAFSLDLELNVLYLTFNELVSSSSFDPAGFTFINEPSLMAEGRFTLSNGSVPLESGPGGNRTLVVPLSEEDTFNLQAIPILATRTANSYLTVAQNAVTDIYANGIEQIGAPDALQASGYTPDTTSPILFSFSLDLNEGLLFFNVSEAVNPNTFDFSQIYITDNETFPTSYQLTGGMVSQSLSGGVVIDLANADEFALKSNTNFTNDERDTFLVATSFAFTDGAGNRFTGVPFTSPLQASSVIPDTSRPELRFFRYLSPGDRPGIVVELEFSEVVDISSFIVAQVLLQDAQNIADITDPSFPLTNSVYIQENRQTLQLNISDADYTTLIGRTVLGTSRDTTFISLPEGTVLDATGRTLIEVPSSNAVQASEYTVDFVNPNLLNFTFDFDSGDIVLTFSEAVSPVSFVPELFTIHATINGPSINYTLTGYRDIVSNGFVTTLSLSPDDYDALNTNPGLATSLNDTFITVSQGVFTDVAGNPVEPVTLQAVDFVADSSPPSLELFEFNLNTGVLTLQFTETIQISSFNAAAITLQSQQSGNPEQNFTLTTGQYASRSSSVVKITLSEEDLDALKALTELATGVFNTYISITSALAADISGLPVIAIAPNSALQAAQFNNDTIRPNIVSFDLDLNTGLVSLEFDEVIDTDTVEPVELSFQSVRSRLMPQLTLTGGMVISDISSTVDFLLTEDDINQLKTLEICIESAGCYISFTEGLVKDTFQLPVNPESSSNAIPVRNYTADSTGPQLVTFARFIEKSAQVELVFTEPVNASTFNFSAILLQSYFEDAQDVLRLSSGMAVGSGNTVNLQLQLEDAVNLRLDSLLCARKGTCYVVLEGKAVLDQSGNPSLPSQPGSPGFIAQDFVIDDQAPTLVSYNLDMNIGLLMLTFDEVMDRRTFQASGISFQASATETEPNYRLTGGTVTSAMFGMELDVMLTESDINQIKATDFAKSPETTFLTLQSSTIRELSASAISTEAAFGRNVTLYTADTRAPLFSGFTLDLNSNRLVLTFSEPMNETTLNLGLLTLQSDASGGNAYSITGGEISTQNTRRIVTIALDSADATFLKLNGTIGTSELTTYLSLGGDAIFDQGGVSVASTPTVLQGVLIMDTSRLTLQSFVLDLLLSEIRLTFDDVALTGTFNPSGITIQDAPIGSVFVNLTADSVTFSPDGFFVTVELSLMDVSELTNTLGIASSIDNTYITLTPGTIMNWNTIRVQPIVDGVAIQASDFISGSNGSELLSFTFDLNSGELALFFSGPVDIQSFNESQFVIQSDEDGTIQVYPKNVNTLYGIDQRVIILQLSDDDLNTLKLNQEIAVSAATTFIALGSSAFLDLQGSTVFLNGTLMAQMVTSDTTSPTVDSFILDLDDGSLTLYFSEAVNATTLNTTVITIQGAQNQSTVRSENIRTLVGGSTFSPNGVEVVVSLTPEDQNYLKAISSLATFINDTFLSLEMGIVEDTSGNPATAITPEVALQASSVISDQSAPIATGFTLDMNAATLEVTFSEVVRISSIDATRATLLGVMLSGIDLGLESGQDGTVLQLDILPPFLYDLQWILSTDIEQNITLLVEAGFVMDFSNTLSLTANLTGTLVSDNTSPLLQNFTLDLATGVISLTFDEVVNETTLDLPLIHLQNDAVSPTNTITLSTDASPSSSLNVVDIEFSLQEFESLRLATDLATSPEDTFIQLESRALEDIFGNPIVAFHAARQAQAVLEDTSQPILRLVTLNMSSGQLVLEFNEAINVSSSDATGVSLHNSSSSVPSYQLTPLSNIISGNGRTIIINIMDDLKPLREDMVFGSSFNNSFVTFASNSFSDISGNALLGSVTPMQVNVLVPDVSGPFLQSFDLDMDSGELVLHFDENVLLSSFNASQIMLQSASSDAVHVQYVPLTTTSLRRENFSDVVVELSSNDLNRLNSMPFLATSRDDTFLSYSAFTVSDLIGNRGPEIPIDDARQVDQYTGDITRPQLVNFEFNLNLSTVVLVFDEVVDPVTVNTSLIYLQNSILQNATIFNLTANDGVTMDGNKIIIQLINDDANQLKIDPTFCSELSDCFITIVSGFASDIAGNPVVPSGPLAISNFTEDTRAPTLVQFVLMDLNSGIVVLSFSEAIDVATIQLTSLRFQSQEMPINDEYSDYTLTGSSATSMNSDILEIELDRTDLNAIKLDSLLCTRKFDCFVRFTRGFITDTSSNPVIEVSNTLEPDRTHNPIDLIRDTSGPVVIFFNLDLEMGLLAIDFDEPVNFAVFRPNEISFQDALMSSTMYRLTGGTLIGNNNTGCIIQLDMLDNGLIKADRLLATQPSNTYLTNTRLVVTDIFGNTATVRADGINPLPVSGFVDDVTQPQFVSFDQFDLETGVLRLTFSEPIDAGAVEYSLITLQSVADPATAIVRNLSDTEPTSKTTVNQLNPNTLELYLAFEDQLFIKETNLLAVSGDTTFLSFSREAFRDTAGNFIQGGLTPTSPSVFLTDALPATLGEFGLDMDNGRLSLTFTDIIRPTVYDAQAVTFQDTSVNPTITYTLTNGTTLSSDTFNFVLEAQITDADLLILKHTIGLATSTDDAFISVTPAVTVNPDNSTISATTMGIQATSFQRDVTPGSLTAFSLDLNAGILSILATEPLDPASFNPSGLTLMNSPNASALGVVSYTLTGGVAAQSNASLYQLEVYLSTADLNMLKRLDELATMSDDVFLSAASSALTDFGQTAINPVSSMAALRPTNFSQDLTPPSLSAIILDLDAGELILSFSEVVNLTSLDASSFQLQTESNASTATAEVFEFEQLILTTQSNDSLSPVARFQLTLGNFEALKNHSVLGNSGSTYISYADSIVIDSNGHYLAGATPEMAMQVEITPDTTPPVIATSELDLNVGSLTLQFDEPVNEASFDNTALSIEVPCGSGRVVSFEPATPIVESYKVLSFFMTETEATEIIHLTTGVCADICLANSETLVMDLAGNAAEPSSGTPVSECTPDRTRPTLLSFALNINTGVIQLSFSEPVSLSNISHLSFQNAMSALYSYQLQDEPDNVTVTGTVVDFALSARDLDGIKATPYTATSRDNTYIAVSEGSFVDTFGNPIVAETHSANILIEDSVPPSLNYFEFGAYNGQLTLSLFFSEPINYTSLDLRQVVLRSDENGSINYTLMYSSPLPIYDSVIRVPLADADTDSIIPLSPLGRSNDSTFLFFADAAALDMQGLSAPAFGPASAVNSQGNLNPPTLLAFWLNLQTRLMQFEFSAPVVVSTFDPTHLTIQSSETSSDTSYTFVGGRTMVLSDTVVYLTLSTEDIDGLQGTPGLATKLNDTFLSLTRGLVQDMSGLAVRPIPTTSALQAGNFTPDTETPRLVGFTLSLRGRDPLILTFSETVLAGSFQPSLMFLLNAPNSSVTFMFSNSTVISGSGTVVEVAITLADKRNLQQMTDIATSVNDTYISISAGVFMDADGLSVEAIPPENALRADEVIPDEDPPQITTFDFDFDAKTLTLYANEPVIANSFSIEAFTLQDSAVNATASYALTNTSSLIGINDFSIINVALSDSDLNAIKASRICLAAPVCFLTHSAGAISDALGQAAINTIVGIQVNKLANDTFGPSLVSFDQFNFAAGTVTLTFNETILAASMDFMGVILQPIYDSANMSVSLTGGTITGDGPTVTIALRDEDLVAIQLNQFLCTSRGTCYINISGRFPTDVHGNELVVLEQGLIALAFVQDDTRPEVANFSLDLNMGNLVLTFTEPVNVELIDISGLAIQGAANSSDAVHFTSGSMTGRENARIVTVALSQFDLNALKMSPFATSIDDTYLTATSVTVRDLALPANYLVAIPASSALRAVRYTRDVTPPTLEQFNLDLDENTVQLVFDEPLNNNQIDLSLFTIHTGMSGAINVTLAGSTIQAVQTGESSTILLDLATDATIVLKSTTEIGTNSTNTNLNIANGAAFDMAGNGLSAVNTAVTSLQPDTLQPELISFSIDLTAGRLHLTFNDVVDPSTFDSTGITLQGGLYQSPGNFYILTNASSLLNPGFGYVLTVNLGSDADIVRLIPAIVNDPYVTMLASTVDDYLGKDVVAITDGKALRASNVTADLSRPEVVAFSLDMNNGRLTVTFTDAIEATSIDVTGLHLQDGLTATTLGNVYPLTGSSGAPSLSPTGTELTVFLSTTDLNNINSIRGLATQANNTFLTIDPSAASDISNNRVVGIDNGAALNVAVFVPDTTPPQLNQFALDLDRGVATLGFTEFVDPLSFDPAFVTVQDVNDARLFRPTFVSFTGSELTSLVPSDMFEVRLAVPVIRQLSFSAYYVTITSDAVEDMAGNDVISISSGLPLPADEVILDTSAPTLDSFSLDLGLATVTLTFSKPILVDTLQLSRATLLSDTTPTPIEMYVLTDTSTSSSDGIVIVVDLPYQEAMSLRQSTHTATSTGNTFLNASYGLARDLLNRSTEMAILQANEVIADRVPPRVTHSVLDLNTGALNLTFDEPLGNLSANSIIFQNAVTNPTVSVQLYNSSVVSMSENMALISIVDVIDVLIDVIDAIIAGLESARDFLKSLRESLSFSFAIGGVSDTSGNTVEDRSEGFLITDIINDMVRPTLVDFTWNLDSENLRLTFSEVIDASSIQLPQLTVVNSTSMAFTSYRLTEESSVLSTSGRVIELHLLGQDAAGIKALPSLGVFANNTYIFIEEEFASDVGGNRVFAINQSQALQASEVFPDTMSPRLIGFLLDLSESQLILTFSETVVISTFNITQITLQATANGTDMYVALQGGYYPQQNTGIVIISLLPSDANTLKDLSVARIMATAPSNTFISYPSSLVEDTAGFPVTEILPTAAQPATRVVTDTVGPMMLAFFLDLNTGNFSLHFDETVNVSTFDITTITLLRNQSTDSPMITLTTVSMATTLSDGTTVMVFLSDDDLNAIKGYQLCNSTNECYLIHTEGLVLDRLMQPSAERSIQDAIMASNIGTDFTNPVLMEFVLMDMDEGRMTLRFSETMYTPSVMFASLTLEAAGNSIALSQGVVLPSTTPVVEIVLSRADLNSIKSDNLICRASPVCQLMLSATFITDYAGNPVEATSLFVPTNFVPDETGPSIDSFLLDLESRTIVLFFDEVVSQFRSTALVIQNAMNASVSYQLTTDHPPFTVPMETINVTLSELDANTLKATAGLAKSTNTTFLTHSSVAALDTVPLSAIPREDGVNALPASFLAADVTQPELVEFTSLDFNEGFLEVSFSEPVDPASYNASLFVIQSQLNGGTR